MYEEIASCPVDLEMLCASLMIQSIKVVYELKIYTVNITESLVGQYPYIDSIRETLLYKSSCLWSWLQHRFCKNEARISNREVLPLPQLIDFPLQRQHFDFITENFIDIKTQLQLMHAALDDLQQKGEQVEKNFDRLQRLLKNISTCSCDRKDPCTCAQVSTAAPSLGHMCKNKVTRSYNRPSGLPSEKVDRLDVPIDVAKPSTALQEQSSALLSQIIKAIDGK
ncbi:unnamed protein product [Peronospora belbahrii]|uniref:Uncharacterized protein n=1 Tax=Peronospora belbahrii TaxID=622444 RepID=A0AAU9LA86_9STRA|nr:unnamed protein product [Peronospora belbahrii]